MVISWSIVGAVPLVLSRWLACAGSEVERTGHSRKERFSEKNAEGPRRDPKAGASREDPEEVFTLLRTACFRESVKNTSSGLV